MMIKRIVYIMLVAWAAILTAAAQLPHSYQCDFEDAAENSLWVLNYTKNSSATFNNKWAIGNAVSSLGMQSMYISPDGGISAGYTFGDSRIMIAWRELDMEAGRYDVAFDWMCGGDSARAALLVAWIPESEFGEMKCMFNDDYKGEGREWLVNNLLKFNGSELLTGGSVWTHAVNTLESDGTPHRLAFFFVYSSTASLVQPGSCVDNIQFSRNNCGEPKNMSVKIASRMAKMEWSSSAEEFNLRMHRMGDNYATQVNGIKQTNFSAQLADGVYDIQIRVICEGDTSVWYNFPTAFVYETTCFDYLDLTDERCSFSMETASDYRQNNDLTYGKIDYGFTSMWSRHTIHYHQEEYDARTFGSIDSRGNSVMPLKTVPEGALASVRVGSWEKTARVARIEYDFTVDAKEASVLMLQYAMVLESSGHDEKERPRLTIDIVFCDSVLSGCHWYILLIPFHFHFWTNEGNDGSSIFFCTDNIEFVIDIQQCFFVRYDYMAVMEHAGAYKVTPDKASYLQNAFISNGWIEHLHRHQMRLDGLLVVPLVKVLLLFLKVHLKDNTDKDNAANDAYDCKRVGAGITIGYYGHTSFEWMNLVDLLEGCIRGTETGGVSDSTTQSANHQGQIVNGRNNIPKAIVDGKHHDNVEHDHASCDPVSLQSSLFQ